MSLGVQYALRIKALEARVKLLEDALNSVRHEHLVVEEDCWFSCPKSGHCCRDSQDQDCNCGADYKNALIDQALKGGIQA